TGERTRTLHLTGTAWRFFDTSRSLQPARQVNAVVRTLGSWQLLVAGSAVCGAVRLRSPGEPIAEWRRSAWEVAHESIHAFAVHPVAVVGDGRILPFLPVPFVRLFHYGGVQGFF